MAEPSNDAEVRVTAAEREAVEARLRHATSVGALTLDEFSDRMGDLLAARTRGDLAKVTDDLPVPAAPAAARPPRQARRWLVAVMSDTTTRGRWRPAPTTTAVAVMGGVEVDLRQAEVEGDEVIIDAYALMGGIDIIVPEGVEVEVGGFAIMGGRDVRVHSDPVPGAPLVRVRAYAVMGGIDVRPPKRQERERSPAREGVPLRAPGYTPGHLPAGATAMGHAGMGHRVPAHRRESAPARSAGARRWLRRGVIAAAIALVTSPIWLSDGGALALFGSQEHVVTQQDVADGEESVYAVPMFGSVEIVVPDGVAVERNGVVIFGSTNCPACGDEVSPSAPVVRVRTWGGFGSAEIVRG